MKKYIVILCALALGLSACKSVHEEEVALQETVQEAPVFHATLEGAQTKVYTDEALHVLWNAEDLVSIFAGTTRNKQYRFKGRDGATGGDFEEVPSGDFGTGSDIDQNYAVYPYSALTEYVYENKVRAYFPQSQTYKAGSFGPGANLMVARSTNTDLSFKNVGSYLCFKLYGEGISVRSLVLKGNNNETLAGPAVVSFGEGNVPGMVFDPESSSEWEKSLVLTADTPVALGSAEADAVTFWMVVPPVQLTGGFTLTVIDSNGGMHEKKTTKNLTFERSKQLIMKAFQLEEEALAPIGQGLYPVAEEGYVYDKETAQINIAEVEGKAWVRFLVLSSLTMHEVGPIPLDAARGDRIQATLTTYVGGERQGEPLPGNFTVNSITGGIMNLVADDGSRYVFRF